MNITNLESEHYSIKRRAADNSTYKKLAVQCYADTFVVNQTLVLRMNICGKNRQLLVAAKRWAKSASLLLPIGLPLRGRCVPVAARTVSHHPLCRDFFLRASSLKETSQSGSPLCLSVKRQTNTINILTA